MTGAEIAWRTLRREKLEEPCIIGTWMMKREFFRHYAGVNDIYRNPVETAVEAYANAGCNLNPQFIMPSPLEEHLACDPFDIPTRDVASDYPTESKVTAEDVRDEIERLPDPDTLIEDFNIEAVAEEYAHRLLLLCDLSRDRTLYITGFGKPNFSRGFSIWSYSSFLTALYLYPDHMERYFQHEGELAKLYNMAVARAVETHGIVPFVYSGDDICFNDGPICSMDILDRLYFPALVDALAPPCRCRHRYHLALRRKCAALSDQTD